MNCKCLQEQNTAKQRDHCDESQAFTVATYDSQDHLAPEYRLGDQYQVAPPASSSFWGPTESGPVPVAAQQLTPPSLYGDISPPRKRQRLAGPDNTTQGGAGLFMPMPATTGPDAADTAAPNKPKRVRTGCLTCRERHLKCDEGLPNCHNCQKSSRVCKRGVRLNFIDTTVKSHPLLPPTGGWKGRYRPNCNPITYSNCLTVKFQDESREIASEYKGGLGRYSQVEQIITPPREPAFDFPSRSMILDPIIHNENIALPPIQSAGGFADGGLLPRQDHDHSRHTSSHQSRSAESDSPFLAPPSTSQSNLEQSLTPPNETRDYLNSPEELLFMQVFVEEVGLWMDSLDPMKHFSRLLPFHSLGEPMLLNAFLACGARHLSLVNPIYTEDKALYYYDTATTQLLRALHNPGRNTVVCATAAVILNVYEIMSERGAQRMNHIAGARALIKECGWNATSTGIGAACFWLNVGMEILSCLHFNWQIAWDPDQWGVDMDFQRELEPGREEIWVYRMLYIVGKISNFRASQPRFKDAPSQEDQTRLESRIAEWENLKGLCDTWNASIPRNMHPIGYLHPSQTTSKSAFPEIW